jgi:hypothetical protein
MIFEFILVFILYIIIIPVCYYVTEVRRLPQWLQFPPFNCRKCLTFWTSIATYGIIGLSFNLYYLMVSGIILAILTAISMHIEQKNKTIKV